MKIILLIVIFSCYVKQKYMVSRDMVFPDELNRFCPLSSFCENEPDTSSNTSSSKSFENEATVMMPCCEECSCSKECGRKRNCCRYEHDFYRLEETLETVCMQLTTLSTGPQQPFYHIIDKCSNRSQTCNTLSTSTLGRFFPVYSRASGMLYYNPKCAGCHGQIDKDLIEFRPLIMCQSLSVSYFTAVSSVTNGSDFPSCYLHFLPPDDLDLSTELCYPGLKRDCNPYMKNSELIEGLCKAFNATFHNKERSAQFGNVYCFLCNDDLSFGDSLDGWNERYVNCPGMELHRMFGLSFAVLLDTSSIDDSKVSTADRRQVELPIWCDSSENQVMSFSDPYYLGKSYLHLFTGQCFSSLLLLIGANVEKGVNSKPIIVDISLRPRWCSGRASALGAGGRGFDTRPGLAQYFKIDSNGLGDCITTDSLVSGKMDQ